MINVLVLMYHMMMTLSEFSHDMQNKKTRMTGTKRDNVCILMISLAISKQSRSVTGRKTNSLVTELPQHLLCLCSVLQNRDRVYAKFNIWQVISYPCLFLFSSHIRDRTGNLVVAANIIFTHCIVRYLPFIILWISNQSLVLTVKAIAKRSKILPRWFVYDTYLSQTQQYIFT